MDHISMHVELAHEYVFQGNVELVQATVYHDRSKKVGDVVVRSTQDNAPFFKLKKKHPFFSLSPIISDFVFSAAEVVPVRGGVFCHCTVHTRHRRDRHSDSSVGI